MARFVEFFTYLEKSQLFNKIQITSNPMCRPGLSRNGWQKRSLARR
jgi:hypothetical protein